MKLAGSREIDGYPLGQERAPSGEILLRASMNDGFLLAAFNSNLETIWHRAIREFPLGIISDNDDTASVWNATGVFSVDLRDGRSTGQSIGVPDSFELGACTSLEEDFILVHNHGIEAALQAPIVQRVNRNGVVLWSKSLPVGVEESESKVPSRSCDDSSAGSMDTWMPSSWLAWHAIISGDAVLVSCAEWQSGMGLAYVLSLDDGMLRYTTKRGPLAEIAALDSGAFLVGFQGYGIFETQRYERDGQTSAYWTTQGYYVRQAEDLRVIEMENRLPSKSHLVRLAADGQTTRGDRLEGYYTSQPYLHADGSVFFARNGALHLVKDLSVADLLPLKVPDSSTDMYLAGSDIAMYCTYKPTMESRTQLTRIDL